MDRNSRVPLWAVLSLGAVLVGGVYVIAQRSVTPPEASEIAQRVSVLPTATAEMTATVTTSIIPTPAIIPTPSISASSISESGGWKTYKNNQFGFQVSYPSSFRRQEMTYSIADRDVTLLNAAYFYVLTISDPKTGILYFSLLIGKTRFSLDEYEKKKQGPSEIDASPVVTRRLLNGIAGFEAYRFQSEGHSYSDQFDFVARRAVTNTGNNDLSDAAIVCYKATKWDLDQLCDSLLPRVIEYSDEQDLIDSLIELDAVRRALHNSMIAHQQIVTGGVFCHLPELVDASAQVYRALLNHWKPVS